MTNESAFPSPGNIEAWNRGMTLRDWFAGMALAGLLAHGDDETYTMTQTADSAYRYADEMLERRERES